MMAEIVIAIALLCGRASDPLDCQQQYIKCTREPKVVVKNEGYNLADCVLKTKAK